MNSLRVYVKFETCKFAKEKGFVNGSDHYWEYALTESNHDSDGTSGPFGWKKGETNFQRGYFINNYKDIDLTNKVWFMCEAPTQTELQKWLREQKKLIVEVNCTCVGDGDVIQYKYTILNHWKAGNHLKNMREGFSFNSYEEALAKGMEEALKLI